MSNPPTQRRTHMLKVIVSYTRYTLALLATVGFGRCHN
jgi:hypothetical protein